MPDHDAGATVCRWVLVLLGGLMLLQALVQLAGANFKAHLRPEDLPMPTGIWRNLLQGDGRETMMQLRCQRPSGEVVHVALHNGQFSERQASAPCLILQAQDTTARRDAETQLQHMAHHDSLTSLANRLRQQVRPINTVGGDESVSNMPAAAMAACWMACAEAPATPMLSSIGCHSSVHWRTLLAFKLARHWSSAFQPLPGRAFCTCTTPRRNFAFSPLEALCHHHPVHLIDGVCYPIGSLAKRT